MQRESRVVPWFQRSLKVDFKTATRASFYMNLPSSQLTLLQLTAHLTIWIIVCCNLKTYARQMNKSNLWAIIIISLIKGKQQARRPDCVLNCYITSDQSLRWFPLHPKMRVSGGVLLSYCSAWLMEDADEALKRFHGKGSLLCSPERQDGRRVSHLRFHFIWVCECSEWIYYCSEAAK